MGREYHLAILAAVLRHVAYRAGAPHGECFQSQAGIAEELRYGRQAVNQALKALVNQGLLTEHPRQRQPCIYRLPLLSPQTTPEHGPALGLTHDDSQNLALLSSRATQGCRRRATPTRLLTRRRQEEEISDSVTPPLPSRSVPGKGMQGEGGDQMSPRVIEAALKKHAASHSWRSTGAGVAHYLKNPDKFTVDLATWES